MNRDSGGRHHVYKHDPTKVGHMGLKITVAALLTAVVGVVTMVYVSKDVGRAMFFLGFAFMVVALALVAAALALKSANKRSKDESSDS